MPSHIDTLLLLALPASGKSELRRYFDWLSDAVAESDLGLGPQVQLDDYPYVHVMRRISEEVRRLDAPPVFFASHDAPFLEPAEWATLIELVNEDYTALGTAPAVPARPTEWMLDRLAGARRAAGLRSPFDGVPGPVVTAVAAALDDEVAEFARGRSATLGAFEPGVSTVVIEFARGGPEGSTPPLPEPYGYAFSLRHLSPGILRRASALYVWVTPSESLRRNHERARPGRDGDASILHHGIPEAVMRRDYGVDDFRWLLDEAGGDAIEVRRDGATYRIRAAVFDNRTDHTSFLREDPATWDRDRVAALHGALIDDFAALR